VSKQSSNFEVTRTRPPKFVPDEQWKGYNIKPWRKEDKKKNTVMFNFVERRKSFFFNAYFDRNGFQSHDMGDHIKEDVRWGKEYGNRMECNPMYFTSGSLLRNLFEIEKQTGLSKEEIAQKYVFLCGGGQCGPCRYGMYPQEYLKVVNDAGFKDFRILIFSSDLAQAATDKGSALPFNLMFRINLIVSIILADLVHMAECALRPYALHGEQVTSVVKESENMILEAFTSRLWLFKLPYVLKKVGKMFAGIKKRKIAVPLIFVTGEFFANLAHNDGNYNLRRFITDEGCEVIPGNLTQRVLYDNWRRSLEAERGIKYAETDEEKKFWKKSLRKQKTSTGVIKWFYKKYCDAMNPGSFEGRAELMDLDEIAELGQDLYHPEIFGGEGNLEIGEAIHLAGKVDGFISSKPFGCMPSSGVSDGVQAKVLSMYPDLNFISIETSGDNDVNVLSRVSMLLFKAKQNMADRVNSIQTGDG
jgi:predicted nucleotide-binding protein (sugar kinase/HSP70/actin superfamily)